MSEDDKVKQLPVRFKKPLPADRTLMSPIEVPQRGCSHLFVQYIISESEAEVECGKCHAKLNPMWVLARLANDDRRFHEAHQKYHEEMKRLSERTSTKCRHCGKMTGISRA